MNHKGILYFAITICFALSFIAGRSGMGYSSSGIRSSSIPVEYRLNRSASASRKPGISDKARARNPIHASPAFKSSNLIVRTEAILSHPIAKERAEEWLSFVKGLSPEQFREIIDQSTLSYGRLVFFDDHPLEYEILLSAWLRRDLEGALEHTMEKSRGLRINENSRIKQVTSAWAKADPESALRWAEDHLKGEHVNGVMISSIAKGLVATDLQLANGFVSQIDGSLRSDVIRDMCSHIARELGQQAARDWATGIERELDRDYAMMRVVLDQNRADPEELANWVLANSGERPSDAMKYAMSFMTTKDSESAIAYFDKIEDPATKASALEGITRELTEADPQRVIDLIDANPALVDGEILKAFIRGSGGKEPELTARAIAHLQDKQLQGSAYLGLVKDWLKRDFESARNWVNHNELPEHVRHSVDEMIQKAQAEQP